MTRFMKCIQKRVKLGSCTLFLADCQNVIPLLDHIDVTITDPPYGILVPGDFTSRIRNDKGGKHGLIRKEYQDYSDTYSNFVSEIVPRLNMAIDVAKRSAIFSGPHIHEQRKPDVIGSVFCPAGSGRHSWGFKTMHPVLLYGRSPDLHLGAKNSTTLYNNDTVRDIEHPCPKPLSWMIWITNLASRENEMVLDPFMGSGTTGVACIKLNRKFIGIEINEKYFDVACKRILYAYNEGSLILRRQRMI